MPGAKLKPLELVPHGRTTKAIGRAPACYVGVSARLPVETYCALLTLSSEIETRTGRPASHQQIFVTAIERFIKRHKAWVPEIEAPVDQ